MCRFWDAHSPSPMPLAAFAWCRRVEVITKDLEVGHASSSLSCGPLAKGAMSLTSRIWRGGGSLTWQIHWHGEGMGSIFDLLKLC